MKIAVLAFLQLRFDHHLPSTDRSIADQCAWPKVDLVAVLVMCGQTALSASSNLSVILAFGIARRMAGSGNIVKTCWPTRKTGTDAAVMNRVIHQEALSMLDTKLRHMLGGHCRI